MVTGAGGFIGSNLCNMLAVEHQVLAISRKFDNLSKNIICKKYDLAEYHNLENEFSSFNPDVVIHCAWQGGNTSKDFES